VSIRTARRQAF